MQQNIKMPLSLGCRGINLKWRLFFLSKTNKYTYLIFFLNNPYECWKDALIITVKINSETFHYILPSLDRNKSSSFLYMFFPGASTHFFTFKNQLLLQAQRVGNREIGKENRTNRMLMRKKNTTPSPIPLIRWTSTFVTSKCLILWFPNLEDGKQKQCSNKPCRLLR